MTSWFHQRKIVRQSGGPLVVAPTLWAHALAGIGAVAAVVLALCGLGLAVREWPSPWAVAVGVILFLLAALLFASCAVSLLWPECWIFDREKGVLVCRPAFSLVVLDLKRISRVVIHTRGPFYRTPPSPTARKVPYWEYGLSLERVGAAPLLLVAPEEGCGEVRALAEAVAEYLAIPIVQRDANPGSTPRPPQLFRGEAVATGLPERVLQLAKAGHRIEAIGAYRELTGRGVDEAREAVDAYLKAKP